MLIQECITETVSDLDVGSQYSLTEFLRFSWLRTGNRGPLWRNMGIAVTGWGDGSSGKVLSI